MHLCRVGFACLALSAVVIGSCVIETAKFAKVAESVLIVGGAVFAFLALSAVDIGSPV